MRYKAFLFDLGNVLLFFSHERMWAQMGEVTGLGAERVRQLMAEDLLQWRYEAGEVTTDALVAHFTRHAARPFTRADLLTAASDIFTPNTAMLPVLKALKATGVRLVVVSNTNEAHMDFAVPRYECFQCFDELIFSYAVGAMKPEPPFYQAALTAAGCAPGDCLFIDDLPENVAGAARSGIDGHVFAGAEGFLKDLRDRGISLELQPL